ncbi:MAG: Protein-methionine-sulfoxide reductase catalytic subunit MsrP [Myxococcota bacterium]|nr:Protein-methionine-sulfoxide reductase catalytic subunit MsrP [Myxococcota bacterium]
MFHIRRRAPWDFLRENQATPEPVYRRRREFLKKMILGGAGLGAASLTASACAAEKDKARIANGEQDTGAAPPAALNYTRNPKYVLDRPLTKEETAAKYNNFYEFTTDKERVHQLTEKFITKPWSVEVAGHCEVKGTFDYMDLIKGVPLEERLYRFRCVEAWAMAVPWIGVPLAKIIEKLKPTAQARYVRFVSFLKPEEAPGQKTQSWYPWPYYEGLTLAEAMNELTLLAVGIYGKETPKQHGAPIRVITPWKYGYKSAKSIVKIEFVYAQPKTFWNDLAPDEYSFESNVNPEVPHPRWSQATERMIDTGERVPTQPYNGYGEMVAHLYSR